MAETIAQRTARLANRILHPLGLHVLRRERAFDMEGLLARTARRGIQIATWIDVGASDGSWSRRAHRHFRSAAFILFEPLAERQAALAALRRRYGFAIVAAAAGAAEGTIGFSVDSQLDGSSVAGSSTPGTRQVPVTTISAAVGANRVPGPYGIKLDTHGFELPIMAGAAAILAQTNFLIIEAYNFKLTDGSLRFHELCAWLEARGFRCCDLADPMRRPGDGALWQMDLAFARADHPMFTLERYV